MSFRKWLERLFWFWLAVGLLLMLFFEVPQFLSFSNGLFLLFYALYAVSLHPQPAKAERTKFSMTLAGVALLPFLVEYIGVTTGKPFGSYQYSPTLGVGIGGVPAAIAAAWVGVIYNSVLLTATLSRFKRALAVGSTAVIFDLVLDPVAFARGFWMWEEGGGFHGVPWSNFAAWFLISALLSLFLPLRFIEKQARQQAFRLYQGMMLMFGLLACKEGLVTPAVIAASMIVWAEWRRRVDNSK